MTKTAQGTFLDMVEEIHKKTRKVSLEEAFEVASKKWTDLFPFRPPYSSFEGFRRFREKQVKKAKT